MLEQCGVVEDEAGDPGAVCGRVADLAALQDRELGGDPCDGVDGVGARAGYEMEGAGAFTIETEVFGEGLRDAHLETLGDEVADGPGIVLQITGCETLVGAVEEGEVLPRSDDLGDLLPLLSGRVNARGVVRAGVE